MAAVVRMPAALAGVTEAAIQTWLVQPGDEVAVGQPIAEIETEKAVVEYAAEAGGTLGQVLVGEGANVPVGTPIAVILAAGESAEAVQSALGDDAADASPAPEPTVAPAPAAPEPETAPEADPTPAPQAPPATQTAPSPQTPPTEPQVASAPSEEPSARRFASPIVRRLARERGIDLGTVAGTGPGGRIVRRDLEGIAAAAPAKTTAPAAPAPPATNDAGGTVVPLTAMRRAIARRLSESKSTVPHFYVTAHCRVDRLLELRREINEAAPRKISVNDFVLKAVAGALLEVPDANAIWGGDHIQRFDTADLGVAIAVEGGLLTPVLRSVERSTLSEISATVADLAERARSGRIRQHELEGGSFAVSNLGMYGVDEFSAILNPPQSGILAVAAAAPRPVVEPDGSLGVGTVMTVTLSADHRVVDGAVAAEWMAAFRRRIEQPLGMLV